MFKEEMLFTYNLARQFKKIFLVSPPYTPCFKYQHCLNEFKAG